MIMKEVVRHLSSHPLTVIHFPGLFCVDSQFMQERNSQLLIQEPLGNAGEWVSDEIRSDDLIQLLVSVDVGLESSELIHFSDKVPCVVQFLLPELCGEQLLCCCEQVVCVCVCGIINITITIIIIY